MNIVVDCEHHSCHTRIDIICGVCTSIQRASEDGHCLDKNINKESFIFVYESKCSYYDYMYICMYII